MCWGKISTRRVCMSPFSTHKTFWGTILEEHSTIFPPLLVETKHLFGLVTFPMTRILHSEKDKIKFSGVWESSNLALLVNWSALLGFAQDVSKKGPNRIWWRMVIHHGQIRFEQKIIKKQQIPVWGKGFHWMWYHTFSIYFLVQLQWLIPICSSKGTWLFSDMKCNNEQRKFYMDRVCREEVKNHPQIGDFKKVTIVEQETCL